MYTSTKNVLPPTALWALSSHTHLCQLQPEVCRYGAEVGGSVILRLKAEVRRDGRGHDRLPPHTRLYKGGGAGGRGGQCGGVTTGSHHTHACRAKGGQESIWKWGGD